MKPAVWRLLLAAEAVAAALATPATAQQGPEFGVQATSLLRDHSFYGIGFSTAYRTAGRTRIAFGGLYGVADETATARAELAGHFMVSPGRRGGVGFYGLGGVAAEMGWRNQAYLLLGLGLETRPAGRSGFQLEAGIGGGFRLSAGWRARWLKAGRGS